MEAFKNAVIVKCVTSAIMDGVPIPDCWGFPDYLLENDAMLETFFGAKIYALYWQLSEEGRREAIFWYQVSGSEINSMVHGPSCEEDDERFVLDCVYFANTHPEYYRAVVAKLICDAYGKLPEDTQMTIYEKFTSEPEVFQDEIDRKK